ncbi:MAG TPA: carboxypeptidase-like regulatory domain-containing protein, partial [Candidatus Sulfotelmatobacter sp.]|nr:carboxypeptidase-like regulatory domain-containing protein [Candidatus Sulfotelmatobacter sp.]
MRHRTKDAPPWSDKPLKLNAGHYTPPVIVYSNSRLRLQSFAPFVITFRIVTAILSTFVAVQAAGQADNSILRGRVSDTGGHAVEGAKVLLYTNTRSEVTATEVSDHLGKFEFSHVAPGEYRLRVIHNGYATIEAAGISLRGGQSRELQITLDPQRALSNAVTETNGVGLRQPVRTLPVRGQASGNLETLTPGAGATG